MCTFCRMGVSWLLSCIALTTACCCNAKDLPETVVVETKYGKVEGDVIKVRDHNFVASAFKGIPFGTAKLFQKPEPVKPWTNVLKARQWGNRCLQHQAFGVMEPLIANDTSEDCLYLNVFAPYHKDGPLSPVMVFIHGGGLAIGSSTEYGQEGIVDWMLPNGVVVVTLNYRLGPWGFFTTGDSNAPGNYGYWDQTLALQWVRDNIDRFGGDPSKVTLFGESAGALSASLLALSPHSRDLFHQSIVMSGSSYLPWFGDKDGHTLEVSDYLSKALGCGPLIESDKASVDTKSVVECIKTKSMAEISEKAHSYRPFGKFEYAGFVTTFDGDFFPQPVEKLQQTAPPKPMISGTTSDETGAFVTPAVFPAYTEWRLNNTESFTVDQLLGILGVLFPETTYHQWAPLIRQLALHHYVDAVGDRRNSSFLVEQYKKLFSDFLFGYPAYTEAIQRHHRGSKVWFYLFDYYDSAIFPKGREYRGAPHFFELPYLFKMQEKLFHPSSWEGNDKIIKDIMTTLWTNFAIYGHPNPDSSPLREEFSWEPINDDHPNQYLHINLKTEQRESYNHQMVSFWHELLPKVLDSLEQSTKTSQGKVAKTEL